MGFVIFLSLMLVPIIEIIGFIQVGSLIGVWATLAIVIFTAIIGSLLLRYQGMAVMFRAQEDIRRGVMPVEHMVTGMFLAFAGALLLTPGFFTDIFGLLLFLPPFRSFLTATVFKGFIAPRAEGMFKETFRGDRPNPPQDDPVYEDGDGPIIDGSYSEVKPDQARLDEDETGMNKGANGRNSGGPKKGDGETPWSRE